MVLTVTLESIDDVVAARMKVQPPLMLLKKTGPRELEVADIIFPVVVALKTMGEVVG